LYDAAGQRVCQTVSQGEVITTTLYLGQYAEARGDELVQYVFGDEQRVARFSVLLDPSGLITSFAGTTPPASLIPTGTLWYLDDHLGGITLQVDETGQAVSEVVYYPYGLTRYEMNGGKVRYRFAGKELDVTGLHYYGARYYDAVTGRFISSDPLYLFEAEQDLGNPLSLSPYLYAHNNPVNVVDMVGLQATSAQKQAGPDLYDYAHRVAKEQGHSRYKEALPMRLGGGDLSIQVPGPKGGMIVVEHIKDFFAPTGAELGGMACAKATTFILGAAIDVEKTALDTTKTLIDKFEMKNLFKKVAGDLQENLSRALTGIEKIFQAETQGKSITGQDVNKAMPGVYGSAVKDMTLGTVVDVAKDIFFGGTRSITPRK
jgi:RHS repeat-associated protein